MSTVKIIVAFHMHRKSLFDLECYKPVNECLDGVITVSHQNMISSILRGPSGWNPSKEEVISKIVIISNHH